MGVAPASVQGRIFNILRSQYEWASNLYQIPDVWSQDQGNLQNPVNSPESGLNTYTPVFGKRPVQCLNVVFLGSG